MENYPQVLQAPCNKNETESEEAELIYVGGDREESRRYFGNNAQPEDENIRNGHSYPAERIKNFFRGIGGIMFTLGLMLAIAGIIMSATVIGIFFGLPMIIAGAFLAWLGIIFIGGRKI